MTKPGYIFKRRHVVISSLSGSNDHVGQEHWIKTCSLHLEAHVNDSNICDQCWEEGRYYSYRMAVEIARAQAAAGD